MKEFSNLIGLKDMVVVLLALIVIRISIVIPFYAQWGLHASITWETFLMFAFGMCFLIGGNNVAVKFYDEKEKITRQTKLSTVNIKEYPDLVRFRGLWIVLWFVGIAATIWASVKSGVNYIYCISAVLTLIIGYAYAVKTRHAFLTGNLSLALLYTIVVLSQIPHDWEKIVPFSYRFPVAGAVTWNEVLQVFVFLAAMVFVLTLLRDITGDVTNLEDDKKNGFATIGVRIGEKKSKTVLYSLSVILMLLCGIFSYLYYDKLQLTQVLTIVVIVILPLAYYMYTLSKAQKQTDYNYLYVFSGMLFISLIFVMFFCKYLFVNGNI